MKKILNYTYWESGSGIWRAGDISDLAHGSNYWWYVPRMLGIPLSEYPLLLKNIYHAIDFHYSTEANVLIYGFSCRSDAQKFASFINKEAKKRLFYI